VIAKEFLSYRESSEGLKPSFISENGIWLERCDELLKQVNTMVGQSQQDCDEVFRAWVNIGAGGVLCRKGLLQTLQKKMIWQEVDFKQWATRRNHLLLTSAQHWRENQSLEQINQNLQTMKSEAEFELYGDLPQYHKLESVPNWFPQQLIRRYNLGLAQGFLLHAKAMDWRLNGVNLEKLRYILRYLKFFGLFYRLIQHESDHVILRIEGPLDLFSGSKRYRMKMAAVSGILPQLGEFELRAKLDFPRTDALFKWSHSDKVKSHYRPFFDYVSPERQVFDDKLKSWLTKSKSSLIEPELNMSQLLKEHVPDYCIRLSDEKVWHVHIYEPHQKSMLLRYMSEANETSNAILMIDKSLEDSSTKTSKFNFVTYSNIPSFTALHRKLLELKSAANKLLPK